MMKVGVIGCGAIARRAHIPAFKSIQNVELYAIADVDEKVVKNIAKRYKIPKYFTDYKELLQDPSISLVSICTPSHTHAEIAINAAENHKHILLEKPLETKLSNAVKILEAVKKNDVKLCVVHNYRYYPVLQNVRKRLTQGSLGEVLSILGIGHVRLPLAWTSSTWLYRGGGVLDDFAPHVIDTVLWLTRKRVTHVYASGGDFLKHMNCPNQVQIVLTFENQTSATLDFSWLTGVSLFTLAINGTGGRIFADVFFNYFTEEHGMPNPYNDLRLAYRKIRALSKGVMTGQIFLGGMAFHKNLISDFVTSVQENAQSPVSGEEALRVVAISEAAKISLKEKSVINVWDLLEKSGVRVNL